MILLVIFLTILFIVAYYLNSREIVSPAVLFSGSLLFGSIWALLNVKAWSLTLSARTFFVIFLGVFEFILVAYFVDSICKIFLKPRPSINLPKESSENLIREKGTTRYWNWKLAIMIVMQLVSIVIISKSILRVTGSGTLSSAIGIIYETNASNYTGVPIIMPRLATVLSIFTFAVGLFFGYHFVKERVFNHKTNWLMLISQLLGIVSTMFSGHRGQSVFILISLLVYFYFFTMQKNGWNTMHNLRYFFYIVIGMIVLSSIFQWTTNILGRGVQIDFIQYISIYTGAEIKNLDTFLRSSTFPINSGIWGGQTFYNQIPLVGKIFRFSVPKYQLDLPFRSVNGYNLGNVYTTFYPWLYDFGYKGVAGLTALMATSSQIVYTIARHITAKQSTSVSILLYGYFSSFIALSFFSNKFYENLSLNLLLYILVWLVLASFIFKEKNIDNY